MPHCPASRNRPGGNPWIGADDIAAEGEWNWTSGGAPTNFWDGGPAGSAQNGLYANWNGGEPNDVGGEDAAQISSGSGGWKDLPVTASIQSLREFSANSLINATTVGGQPVYLNAANGKYYQRTTTGTSWIDAKAISESRQLQGVQGHLVQVNDAVENGFLQNLGVGWIGLTDEAIFNGGNGLAGQDNFQVAVWSSAYNSSFVPGTTTLASTVYTNWNGSEPNGGNGENYVHTNGDGTWNDLANSGSLSAIIEYDVTVPRDFLVRDIKATGAVSGGAAGINQGIAMANNLVAGSSEASGNYAAINFGDPGFTGGSGDIGGETPFPNNAAGDDQNFIVRARGAIVIPTAGNYRFRFNNDDSTQLVVADQVFQDNGCCSQQTSPVFNLSAGVHNVTAMFTEIAGGGRFEVLGETAPGSNVYQLMGDTVNGGLATAARKEIYVRKEGFTTRDVKSGTALNSLSDALTLLGGSGVSETTTSGYTTINFEDPQNPNVGERFGLDAAFPNNSGGDDEDFATSTTARLFVPDGSVGIWT